jgi:hypothetical protein
MSRLLGFEDEDIKVIKLGHCKPRVLLGGNGNYLPAI